MTIDKSLIQVWTIHVRGALASDGPRGVLIEFSPTVEALHAAGITTALPPLRFVMTENIARQLVAAIPRQLENTGAAPEGETIH